MSSVNLTLKSINKLRYGSNDVEFRISKNVENVLKLILYRE